MGTQIKNIKLHIVTDIKINVNNDCDIRTGTLVGEDKYGNKYYENPGYPMGRNRFVVFPYEGRMEYDGSQIPPEWHRWMQHMTDDDPVSKPPTDRKFFVDHYKNPSGSDQRYVPYSTTKPKLESWTPPPPPQ